MQNVIESHGSADDYWRKFAVASKIIDGIQCMPPLIHSFFDANCEIEFIFFNLIFFTKFFFKIYQFLWTCCRKTMKIISCVKHMPLRELQVIDICRWIVMRCVGESTESRNGSWQTITHSMARNWRNWHGNLWTIHCVRIIMNTIFNGVSCNF